MFLYAKTISKQQKPASDYLLKIFNAYNNTKLSLVNQKHIKHVCNCMVYNLTKPIDTLKQHRTHSETL